jgi:transmembrane 9 superfamily protein 2/4
MGTDEQCGILCTKSHSKKELEKFRMLIDEEYRVQWQLDGLPVTMRIEDEEYIERGFPLGYVENVEGGENTHYLYNHVRIIVKFSENEEEFDGKRIVGFEVVPMSVNHQVVPGADGAQNGTPSLSTCKKDDPYVIEKQDPQVLEGKEVEVLYTYDVVWEESEIAWANR